jgi:hypothetical protein
MNQADRDQIVEKMIQIAGGDAQAAGGDLADAVKCCLAAYVTGLVMLARLNPMSTLGSTLSEGRGDIEHLITAVWDKSIAIDSEKRIETNDKHLRN